ncbi:MAG: hypothetical protein ACRD59_02660 [Candidatus Acidiferrales bacterium]
MVPNRDARNRFSLVLVIFLLFCSLSAIEYPEFLRLTDDTSNDFTLLVSGHSTASAHAFEKSANDLSATQDTQNSALAIAGPTFQFPVRTNPVHSPTGYRHLLCIYRT